MPGLTVKMEMFSAGLLSSPLRILKSITETTSRKVVQGAQNIKSTGASPTTILAKADFTDSEEVVYVIIANTTTTANKYIQVDIGSQDAFKIGPGAFAVFPWYVDNTDGGDIAVWSNDASVGVNVEFTAVELS